MIKGVVHGADGTDVPFKDVDFISFVSDKTYGKPALIAPGEDHVQGQIRVLYVNPSNMTALDATKIP